MDSIDVHSVICQQMVELVTDYLEGKLSPLDRARFEVHVKACTNCSNYLAQMRQTLQLLGHLSAESVAPEAQDELLEVFRRWKQGDSDQ